MFDHVYTLMYTLYIGIGSGIGLVALCAFVIVVIIFLVLLTKHRLRLSKRKTGCDKVERGPEPNVGGQ